MVSFRGEILNLKSLGETCCLLSRGRLLFLSEVPLYMSRTQLFSKDFYPGLIIMVGKT